MNIQSKILRRIINISFYNNFCIKFTPHILTNNFNRFALPFLKNFIINIRMIRVN